MFGLEKFSQILGGALRRHRWSVIAASLAVTVVFGLGLAELTFSTDYRIFFAPDDPHLRAFERLERDFARTDNIVFAVSADDGDVFDGSTLAAVRALTERAWTLPHARRVDSLTNFQHSRADELGISVEELVPADPGQLSASELSDIRRVAMGEPLLLGGLLAEDGSAAGVNVILHLPRESPAEVTEAAQAARALAVAIEDSHPGITVHASGMALMNDAFMEVSIQDMSRVMPVMYLVMLLVLLVALRSVRATAAVAMVVALSSTVAMGVAGWLGYPLTPPSAAAPTIVMTLAIADGVHLVISARQALGQGMTRIEAVCESLRVNLRPMFLTSLTTAGGFLCLNFAEAAPYWHLGNMTAAGIGAAFIFSVTFLPAVLIATPLRPLHARAGSGAFYGRLIDFVGKRAGTVLVATGALALVAGALVSTLSVNDRFLQYFDDGIAFRPDTEAVLGSLGGLYGIEFLVDSEEEGGVNEPAYLAHLAAFATWLRAQPEVSHVHAYSDVMKRLHQNLHDDDPAFYALPQSRELAAQYLLLYEMSLPRGRALTDRIDASRLTSRVSVVVGDLSSREVQAFSGRAERWLIDHAPEVMRSEATSPVVIFSHLSERNAKSMLRGNVLTLILISVALFVAFGSIRLGLVSVVPNLLPLLMGYGLWALFFGEVSIIASVAGAVCLGIVVDDTIHFLNKYEIARRETGTEGEQAVRRAAAAVGPALMSTSAILIAGFLVLTLSSFSMNVELGLLTAMVVALALVADLVVLPALLIVTARTEQRIRRARLNRFPSRGGPLSTLPLRRQ